MQNCIHTLEDDLDLALKKAGLSESLGVVCKRLSDLTLAVLALLVSRALVL